jgi:hypothetical protein
VRQSVEAVEVAEKVEALVEAEEFLFSLQNL